MFIVDDEKTVYVGEPTNSFGRVVGTVLASNPPPLFFGFSDRTYQIGFNFAIDRSHSTTIHHRRQCHDIKCVIVAHNNGGLTRLPE